MATTTVYSNCSNCCEQPVSNCCEDDPPPNTLYVTFDGSLSAIGTVELTLNISTWEGSSVLTACGSGNQFSFFCDSETGSYTLSASPGDTNFVAISNPPTSCTPFSWTASGTATGTCSGNFSATVTETPP